MILSSFAENYVRKKVDQAQRALQSLRGVIESGDIDVATAVIYADELRAEALVF